MHLWPFLHVPHADGLERAAHEDLLLQRICPREWRLGHYSGGGKNYFQNKKRVCDNMGTLTCYECHAQCCSCKVTDALFGVAYNDEELSPLSLKRLSEIVGL